MYVHLYLYIHIYAYIHIHIYIYVYTCVYIHMCLYSYPCVYLYICVYACMYVNVQIHVFWYIHIFMYVIFRIIHTHMHTHAHMHIPLYTSSRTLLPLTPHKNIQTKNHRSYSGETFLQHSQYMPQYSPPPPPPPHTHIHHPHLEEGFMGGGQGGDVYSNFGMSDFKNENLLAKEEMERRGVRDPRRYALCWSRNWRGI